MRDFSGNSKMQAAGGSDSSSEEDELWDRCVIFISELVEELVEGEAVSPAGTRKEASGEIHFASCSSVTVRVHVGGLHHRQ